MKAGKKLFRAARIALAALFFALMLAAFSGLAAWAARMTRLEFAPALLRCCAAFSAGALAVVSALLVLTWIFGRFYCAFLCPLGIWQDAAGWMSRRAARREKDRAAIRYIVGGATFGIFAGGWALPFVLLDPYSNFGRFVAGGFVLGGVVPLVLITLLAAWKKRIFCTTLCPVGTLLGLCGRFGLFKLRLTEKCVKCNQCVKVCPSGCVDPAAGTLDNERCVRCLNCLSVCRLGGVEYTLRRTKRPKPENAPPDKSRREFLVRGGALLAGVAAGFAAARLGAIRAAARVLTGAKHLILPPGAGDLERFAQKCTACRLCEANCPAKIVVPAPGGDGPVRLDLSRGACKYDCNKCSAVCPTGALKPLKLEDKRRTKIAEAEFDPKVCIAFQTEDKCGRCAKACPTGAIKLRKNGTPKPVDKNRCIGCGACQAACPAAPKKAMTVHGIERQTLLEG